MNTNVLATINYQDPAAINLHLTTIIDIREFLKEWRNDNHLSLGQFCKDWIEENLDRIEDILESEDIATDDETFCGTIGYRAQNLCDVLRPETDCYQFFFQLARRCK